MRILRAIVSLGTHLGQERLGHSFAAMGQVSPLRYLDARRNLIWDQEPESVAATHTQKSAPRSTNPKGV